MDAAKAKIIEERNKAYKKKANKYLFIFLAIAIGGYLFFFSSTMWMPAEKDNVKATKMFVEIEANDRIMTPIKWVYSPDTKQMELIIEIKKVGTDSIDTYDFTAVSRGKGIFHADNVKKINDNYVIRFSGIKNGWNEISFRIDGKYASPSDFATIKMYAVEDDIETAAKIKEKSDIEYLKEVSKRKIDGYQAEIKRVDKQIKEQKKIISEGEEAIKELERDVKYQTEEEIEKTTDAVSKIDADIKAADSKISQSKDEIDELNEKIKKQEEKLKDLK
jgi:hypothetical protein